MIGGMRLGSLSSKDIEYRVYTLGDIKVIELLIAYRYKYDENLFLNEGVPDMMGVIGGARLNEEVIITYADLDKYIEKCKFDVVQLEIIKLVGEGYSNEEIADVLDIQRSTTAGRLQTIYSAIARENEWQWRRSVYEHKLGLRNKTCNKCSLKMPATSEFYSNDNRNKDGFQGRCRKCKS